MIMSNYTRFYEWFKYYKKDELMTDEEFLNR